MEQHTPANRSEKTRDALLNAAVNVFGKAGYDAASNRAIAEAAGANQALIGYHFGGKRGLYLAVFEHITEQWQLDLLPVVSRLRTQFATISMSDNDRRERCIAFIETLLFAMLDNLNRPETKAWARLIMREQQDPSDAFEVLYEGFMKQLLGALSEFAAMAEGIAEENDATRMRGIFLASHILIFAMAPSAVGRHLGWTESTPANLNTIKVQLHHLLQQQFTGEPSL
ncbi:MAG: CerR family C-terminal domain-containing protein [Halioglobus sp.]